MWYYRASEKVYRMCEMSGRQSEDADRIEEEALAGEAPAQKARECGYRDC